MVLVRQRGEADARLLEIEGALLRFGAGEEGVPTACGRFGLLAVGRFPPPFFIASGAPKQADSASAALAATNIRSFKNAGTPMTSKYRRNG